MGQYGTDDPLRSSLYQLSWASCSGFSVSGGNTCNSQSHRGSCSIGCNTGFRPSGSGYYTCKDGSWQSGSLTCTQMYCPALSPLPANSVAGTCGSQVAAPNTCQIECPLPYVRTGSAYTCAGDQPLVGAQSCIVPCEGAPAAVANGEWARSPSSPYASVGDRHPHGTIFTLNCVGGRSSINPTMTCNAGVWQPKPGVSAASAPAFCVDLRLKAKLSVDLTTMSPYSGRITFGNDELAAYLADGRLSASSISYRYKPELKFPVVNGPDAEQPPLRGVRFKAGTDWASFQSDPFTQLTSDDNSEIEHARFQLGLEARYTHPSTGLVSTGPQTSESISLPCSCNQAGALENPLLDPNTSLMYGTPLGVSVSQLLNSANQLQIRFTPNSLCTTSYSVSAVGLDGTEEQPSPVDVIPVTVQQMHVENEQSCSFLTTQKEPITTVAYPLYGRPLRICIQPLPRTICSTCTSSYGTRVAEGDAFGGMPQTCVEYTASFFASASGTVNTKASALAPIPAPVPDVSVTLTILDAETREPVLVPDGNGGTMKVTTTVKTDEKGRYKAQVSSPHLQLERYVLEVLAAKADVDGETGEVFNHRMTHVDSQTDPFYQDGVLHADSLTQINFVDLSEVPITGSVILPTGELTYGSDALQGCGVPNVVVTAYAYEDTALVAPLRRSAPTDNLGNFVLTSPLYTKIRLVPSVNGPQINHTFSPSFRLVDVRQSAIQMQTFEDTTMAEFDVRFTGGHCEFAIGAIAPVINYESCNVRVKLPPFGSLVKTYRLPAQLYKFRLYDNVYPTSGLQYLDLDENEVPGSYVNGPVGEWVLAQQADTVDLIDALTEEKRPELMYYRYYSIPDVRLETPPSCSDDLVQEAGQRKYMYAQANSIGMAKFILSESYGWEGNAHVCNNVTAGVSVIDGVTNPAKNFISLYRQEPYNCNDLTQACVIPAEFNANYSQTSATYVYFAGDISQATNSISGAEDDPRTKPAYTKSIQFKLADSALSWQTLHVALLGTYSIPGSLSLTYPPWDPIYILRDPPGGSSVATLTAGSTLSTETGVSLATSTGSSYNMMAGISGEMETEICVGLGAATCNTAAEISMSAKVGGGLGVTSSDNQEKMSAQEQTFESSVTTSDDPNYVNGLGDLYLTVSGSLQVQTAYTVSGKIEKDEESGTQTCITTLKPSIAWQRDPSNTLTWSSGYDIEFVTIPLIEKQNRKLLAMYSVLDKAGLEAAKIAGKVPADAWRAYLDNEVAVAGWRAMLAYNQALKDASQPWPEFYQHMAAPPGASGSLAKSLLDKAHAAAAADAGIDVGAFDPAKAAGSGGNGAGGGDAAPGALPAYGLTSDGNIGSVTFFGGNSQFGFTLSVSSSTTSSFSTETAVSAEIKTEMESTITAMGIGLSITGETSLAVEMTHGATAAATKANTLTISIVLADPDAGDQFKPVYGSPVYRVLGGQSRCQWEPPTVHRDWPTIGFAVSQFDHVNPRDKVSTVVSLGNLSPTEEAFAYTLSMVQESNLYGLKLTINGAPLTTAGLIYNIEYQQTLQVTVDIERGSNGYSFEGVTLALTGIGGGGDCRSETSVINIFYDEPCSEVSFAGTLQATKSFTINRELLDARGPSAKPSLSITVRNPEYSLLGRKWLDQYSIDKSGFLQSLQIQYRAAPVGGVLTELDWESIRIVGNSGEVDLLAMLAARYLQTDTTDSDYISVEWDMSALTDQPYQLRAITQCTVPTGALDTSLYVTATPVIQGVLDITPPAVFGEPLPSAVAAMAWMPGQPISVTFDEAIECASRKGKTLVKGWINAGSVAGLEEEGIAVSLRFVCRGDTLTVAFHAPIWEQLVDRLVTVEVSRVRDSQTNLQEFPATWSFAVSNFNVFSSSVQVTNLMLSLNRESLITQYVSLAAVQAQLAWELSDLANLATDVLNGTQTAEVHMQTSEYGLQAGAVLVTSVAGLSATSTRVTFNILALPRFPGDPEPRYSPSFFAAQLVNLLAKYSASTPVADTEWGSDAERFPLLSNILLSDTLPTATVQPLPNKRQTAARAAMTHLPAIKVGKHMSKAAAATVASGVVQALSVQEEKAYTDFDFLTSLSASQTASLLKLSWITNGSYAVNLAASDVKFSYTVRTLVSVTDPDALQNLPAPVTHSVEVDDAAQASLVCNVREPNAQNNLNHSKALCEMTFWQLPIAAGGSQIDFTLDVSSADAPAYSLVESLFVVSVPATPVVHSVAQTDINTIKLQFLPSTNNGLAFNAGDADVHYDVTISNGVSASPLVLTSGMASFDRKYSPLLRSDLITCTVNLTAVSASLAMPSLGTQVVWKIGARASNALGSSPVDAHALAVASAPSVAPIYRLTQTGNSGWDVRINLPVPHANIVPLTAIDLLYRYRTLSAPNQVQGGSQSLQLNGTLRLESNELSDASGSIVTPAVWLAHVELPTDEPLLDGSLQFAVRCRSALADSEVKWHNAEAPVFVPPTGNVTLAVKEATPENATVELSWLPFDSSLLRSPDLFLSYSIRYSYTDDRLLHGELDAPIEVDSEEADTALNVTIPLLVSPSGLPNVRFTFSVSVKAYSTNNPLIISRGDATGRRIIESAKRSVEINIVNGKVAANAMAVESDSSHLPLPTLMPNNPRRLISNQLSQLSGVATANVAAPLWLRVHQLVDSAGSVLLSFPVSSTPGVQSYTLAWFDAHTPDLPLGAVSVPASVAINGMIVQQLASTTLVVPASMGDKTPSHPYAFSVHANVAAGSSQQRMAFARVLPAQEAGPVELEKWVESVEISTLVLVAVLIPLVALSLYRLFRSGSPAASGKSIQSFADVLPSSASNKEGGVELVVTPNPASPSATAATMTPVVAQQTGATSSHRVTVHVAEGMPDDEESVTRN